VELDAGLAMVADLWVSGLPRWPCVCLCSRAESRERNGSEREKAGRSVSLLSKADECDRGGMTRAREKATRWLNPAPVGHRGEVRLAIRAPLAD
jgi:hypothetical protein